LSKLRTAAVAPRLPAGNGIADPEASVIPPLETVSQVTFA
jgi:hypothetical protein